MHNSRFPSTLIWMLVMGLMLAVAAHADVTIQVISVKGRVEYRNGPSGDWEKVYRGARLRRNAFVRTHEEAEVVLKIGTRGVVTVHEMSTIIISSMNGSDAEPQSKLNLLVGKIWARWKKPEETDGEDAASMEITTPAAVASVRGTTYYVESDELTKNCRVGVWEGEVAVGSRQVRGAKSVKAGFEILVLYNEQLIDPRKMEIERIKREQEFNKQIETLGLAGLFGRGVAEVNEVLVNETENTIKDAAAAKRGEEQVRKDFETLKVALAKLYADTGFMPGKGFNKAAGAKSLRCLVANDDGRGKEIDGWAGPYMDTDFKDPFGKEYAVYQKRIGSNSMMVLVSLGLDGVISNDDIEKPYSENAVKRDAEDLK